MSEGRYSYRPKMSEATKARMRQAAIARFSRAGERETVRDSNKQTCGDPLYRAVKRRLADEQPRNLVGHWQTKPAKAAKGKKVGPNLYRPVWYNDAS